MKIQGMEFRAGRFKIDGNYHAATICIIEGHESAALVNRTELGRWEIYGGHDLIGSARTYGAAKEMLAELYARNKGDLWDYVARIATRGANATLALKHGKD